MMTIVVLMAKQCIVQATRGTDSVQFWPILDVAGALFFFFFNGNALCVPSDQGLVAGKLIGL